MYEPYETQIKPWAGAPKTIAQANPILADKYNSPCPRGSPRNPVAKIHILHRPNTGFHGNWITDAEIEQATGAL